MTVEDVRAFASPCPGRRGARAGPVKFRVGRLVFVAFSRDETLMGFGFPKDEREALVAVEPDKFLLPEPSDLRYRGSSCGWRRST